MTQYVFSTGGPDRSSSWIERQLAAMFPPTVRDGMYERLGPRERRYETPSVTYRKILFWWIPDLVVTDSPVVARAKRIKAIRELRNG